MQMRYARQYSPLLKLAVVLAVSSLLGIALRKLNLQVMYSALYMTILLGWCLMLQRRIMDRRIRLRLICAALLMLLLFVLRVCRYEIFCITPALKRYFWYLYYPPFTGVQVFTLSAAMFVGKEVRLRKQLERVLLCAWVLLNTAILTNDLHQAMFTPKNGVLDPETHGFGWLYIFTVCWICVLTLAMFLILLHRSSILESKKNWRLPVITAAVFILLIVFIYYFDPQIFGMSIINLQELFCFLYIALIELYIHSGLIPSNTGYDAILRSSPTPIEIQNKDGETVFQSECALPEEDEDFRKRSADISGGSVIWTEDLSQINRKNLLLEEAVDTIESENILIEQENAARIDRQKYEAMNRLYDKIALAVRPQVLALEQLLSEDLPQDESADRLRYATVLGAYIKRFANLMLLSHESPLLPAQELLLCMRESMEYLTLSDVTCAASCKGEALFPCAALLLSYSLFETVIEQTYGILTACEVRIEAENDFCFCVLSDCPVPALDDWKTQELTALGASLCLVSEDETTIITLKLPQREVDT